MLVLPGSLLADGLNPAEIRAAVFAFEAELEADPLLLERDSLSVRSFADAAHASEARLDEKFETLSLGFEDLLGVLLDDVRSGALADAEVDGLRANDASPERSTLFLAGPGAVSGGSRLDLVLVPSACGASASLYDGPGANDARLTALPCNAEADAGRASLLSYLTLKFHAGPAA